MFKNMPTAALIVPQSIRLYYKKINHSLQRVKSLQSSYLDMHVKCTLYNFCIERGWRCPIFSPVVTWGGGLSGAHVVEEGGPTARGICCGCGFTDTSPRE